MTATSTTTTTKDGTTTIEAPADLPLIRITREFRATPAQLFRAHTDADLFSRWTGPDGTEIKIDQWDPRTGGSWRYLTVVDGEEYGFRGCFHTVREDRLVQTFTWEGMPDGVALETMVFEELGDGRTRIVAESLVDRFETRDAILASGMEVGINDGYARLDGMLADGDV
jgi:uncharacterized protein YndB with AHSA1/START domain